MRIPELEGMELHNKCSHTIYVFSVETPLKPSTGYGSCKDSPLMVLQNLLCPFAT